MQRHSSRQRLDSGEYHHRNHRNIENLQIHMLEFTKLILTVLQPKFGGNPSNPNIVLSMRRKNLGLDMLTVTSILGSYEKSREVKVENPKRV